nr:hypothetical protein [uncultured Desulfobulbus sp.]
MEKKLNKKQVQNLFIKFSYPLLKSAITDHQKKVSLGIAKTLWVALVGENDTEKQIYNILNDILNGKHEANIQIGSLYYFKMKAALTENEIKSLISYYSIDKNIKSLEQWLD